MKQKQIILKASMVTLAMMTGVVSLSTLTNTTPVYADCKKENTFTKLLDTSTSWKYLDTNVDPGTADNRYAWTTANYADTAWKTAAGKFGHKSGALSDLGSSGIHIPTVLLDRYIDGTNNAIPTYFFRTTFDIQTLDDINSLTGSIDYDDAAIIYINGVKMTSFDEPAGGYETNMTYGGSNGSAPKTGDISISKDKLKDVLKQGSNTIAVEIHQGRASSSDVYFNLSNLQVNYGEVKIEQKALSLTVGKDESEMNLTWYASSSTGEVQYAKASAMVSGNFPKQYSKITAKSNLSNDSSFNYHQATIDNLSENTKYVYRLVNEDTVGELHYFTTKDFDQSFNFIFAGDPQIGASGNAQGDSVGWGKTLESSIQKFNPNFILSGGDQVNTASNESEYNGYLNQEELTSVPQSPSIGNHDSGSSSYSQHFNLPNVSDKGKTTAGGDYYYVYNNTLFLNINTNNTSTAEHKEFLKQAIDANQDVRWKVVTFHHSIYSVASHAVETGILNLRNNLVPVFDELGIDVVLMGHDHVYVRSHIMKDLQVTQNTSELSSVTDPNGILYVTANSASGSKYYSIQNSINMDFVAKKDQSKQRSISNITVSDNEFKITTHLYNSDTNEMSILDEFSVKKSAKTNESDMTLTPQGTSSVKSTILAPKGTIVDGSKFNVNEMTNGTVFDQVKQMLSNKAFKLLDLSLMKNDTQVDPLGQIQIQFELPKGYTNENLLIYKIDNTKNRSTNQMQLDKVDFKVVDGKIIVSTDMLGQFVLVDNKQQTPDIDQTPSQPDITPDQNPGNTVTKPNPQIPETDTTEKDAIKTSDNSEIISYGILGLTGLSCVYVVTRKKKIKE